MNKVSKWESLSSVYTSMQYQTYGIDKYEYRVLSYKHR